MYMDTYTEIMDDIPVNQRFIFFFPEIIFPFYWKEFSLEQKSATMEAIFSLIQKKKDFLTRAVLIPLGIFMT